MGCSESKIDNLKPVYLCKERETSMNESVSALATFSSAHFAYATAIRNTGIALYDYARSEFQSLDHHPPRTKNGEIVVWDFFLALMEDVNVVDDDKWNGIEIEKSVRRNVVKSRREVRCGDGGGGDGKVAEDGGEGAPTAVDVFSRVNDGFNTASESACDASKIYENGHIKRSTRVTKAINNGRIEFSYKEKQSHATLLNEMLVWEKKLYHQVKSSEMGKHEYQKKVSLLNKLTDRGASSEKLERAQATVNQLRSICIVDMQSIDSIVSEINRLRDKQLYPHLVQIIEVTGKMWENMRKQHRQQLMIVQELSNDKISQVPKDSSEINLKNIERIYLQVTIWCSEFDKFMLYQKEYIKSLSNWLKVTLISIDNNVKPQNPKIKSLLRTWKDQLEKLPEDVAKTAINSLAVVTNRIVAYHSKETKMKERCDKIRREMLRNSRRFEEWCDKQMSKRIPSEEMDADVMDDMDVIAEQQVAMEVLKRRLEDEEEGYRRYRVEVKEKSLMEMKSGLLEVFMAMEDFCEVCSVMYGSLRSHYK